MDYDSPWGHSQYSFANGQLWSLQIVLALATSLTIHVVAGSEDEPAVIAQLISRGAAPVMLLIHIQ